jgi:hypothetical protein
MQVPPPPPKTSWGNIIGGLIALVIVGVVAIFAIGALTSGGGPGGGGNNPPPPQIYSYRGTLHVTIDCVNAVFDCGGTELSINDYVYWRGTVTAWTDEKRVFEYTWQGTASQSCRSVTVKAESTYGDAKAVQVCDGKDTSVYLQVGT